MPRSAHAPPDRKLADEAAFVVHRIGPETYSVVLKVEGMATMVSADYFRGPDEAQAAVLWLKRHASHADVIWQD
jgi:hypothetical protein